MYGVPTDLDLDIFTGAGLEQVCVGQFHVQFNFEGGRSIGVEGRWQILGQLGDPFADVARGAIGTAVPFHPLLGQRVVGGSVHPPEWFELRFEGGFALRIFDDSEQYESFSIQPGDIFV